MPGINERVNKSKEGRESERKREKEGGWQGRVREERTKSEKGEIKSEGERAGRRREHGDQSAAVYPLFAGVR